MYWTWKNVKPTNSLTIMHVLVMCQQVLNGSPYWPGNNMQPWMFRLQLESLFLKTVGPTTPYHILSLSYSYTPAILDWIWCKFLAFNADKPDRDITRTHEEPTWPWKCIQDKTLNKCCTRYESCLFEKKLPTGSGRPSTWQRVKLTLTRTQLSPFLTIFPSHPT